MVRHAVNSEPAKLRCAFCLGVRGSESFMSDYNQNMFRPCGGLQLPQKVTSYGHSRLFRPENSASWTFWRGRFGVDVSASTSRRRGFGADVSPQTFRGGRFGAQVSARYLRQHQNFMFKNDTTSSLEKTQCSLWKDPLSSVEGHNVLFARNALSSLHRTQCPLWKGHNVLFAKNTMTSVERTQCPP